MADQPPRRPKVTPLPAEPIVPPPPGAPRRMSLAQAMALAEQQRGGGAFEQAESTLRQVLRAQPDHAPALHLLGVVLHQRGQTAIAIDFIARAIELDPKQALYHSNHGEMCRLVGRLDDAIAAGERALALQPNSVAALSNLGIAHYDRKDLDRAEEYQRRALAINPKCLPALNNLGSIQRERHDRDSAIDWYRRALAVEPKYVEAMNNLGAVLTESERFEEAADQLRAAIGLRPQYPDAHSNLGLALAGLERYDDALAAFLGAIELKPTYVEAHIGLARVLQEKNVLDEAARYATKALELGPDRADAHALAASISVEQGFPERALEQYRQALELDPDSVRAHQGLGALQMELGRLDESERHYRRTLELDPEALAPRIALAHVKKVSRGDDNLVALQAATEDLQSMPRQRAVALHYALGKCYDDVGEYDQAFHHFAAGARLKRTTVEYNSDDFDGVIDRIIAFFDAPTLARLRGRGAPSTLPVFVLGAARSGTTLTEQIIASHPQAYGAGELHDLLNLANQPRGGPTNEVPFPQNMADFTATDIGMLGNRYVAGLRKRAPDALRITDKMPANFLCIGLIHAMLPNARIVHVRRDPVDTCLSQFSRLFARGQPHSYDLTEVGRHYRAYARLMDHWRRVLPEGSMLDVQYEALVADTEPQARRLIDYCGLEWNDACLEFHKHDRSVRTASVIQVRQPIYTTSLARWKRYERHLGPLLEALGDLVPSDQNSME